MRVVGVLLAVSLLIGVLPVAAWEEQDGQFVELFGGSGGRFAAEGEHPNGAEELFATPLPEGQGQLLLDRSGHVLTFPTSGTAVTQVVAVDAATGDIAWESSGSAASVRPRCVAVAPDGTVWALSADESELLGIDPTDGTVTTAHPSPIRFCHSTHSGLRMLPDDHLLVVDDAMSRIKLVDLATGTATTMPDAPVRSHFLLTSADGRRAYAMQTGAPLQLLSVDLSTGMEVDRITLPGAGLGSAPMQQAFVLPDGGIILATDSAVLRVDDDGSGALEEVWRVTPDDEVGPVPSSLLPVGPARDLVVGWQARDAAETLVAFDVSDGSLAWRSDRQPGPSGGVSTGLVLSDAAGNVVVPQIIDRFTDDGRFLYDVFDASGEPIGQSPPDVGRGVTGMVLGPDGTLYLRSSRDDSPVLLAISPGPAGPFTPGVSRIDAASGEVTDIAVNACRVLHPRAGTADRVLLARVDVFADALAGAPLAGRDACILYTAGGPAAPLDERTAAEIDRVLSADGLVQILGGTNAVSAVAEATLTAQGVSTQRFDGDSRFQTATLIADAVRLRSPEVDEVILATAGDWPDAVTGGALGAVGDVPILLTEPAALNATTAAWLQADGTARTLVVGGVNAISDAAAAATPGPRRVAGSNRMATAAAIASQEWASVPGYGGTRFMVVNLERADAWTVALAGAPLAASGRAPQLGVGSDTYPAETESFLRGRGFTDIPSVLLVGDAALISDGVAARVDADIRG